MPLQHDLRDAVGARLARLVIKETRRVSKKLSGFARAMVHLLYKIPVIWIPNHDVLQPALIEFLYPGKSTN